MEDKKYPVCYISAKSWHFKLLKFTLGNKMAHSKMRIFDYAALVWICMPLSIFKYIYCTLTLQL